MSGAEWLLVYAVLTASAASVVWFFQVRRQMLAKMRAVVGILEDVFKPRDQTYTLLGYLVGFRAEYRLPYSWAPRAWALYTMPPGHVFFYLPVVLLRGMRDRLELTIQLREPLPGEAHVYDPRDRATRRLVARDTAGREERLRRATLSVDGRSLAALYSGERALELALGLLGELRRAGVDAVRVTVADRERVLHVAAYPRLSQVRVLAETLLRYARRLSRGGEG